ncbi:hypothetical protein SARC_12805 [Sphaeroforma arctica JP610]|uniref:Carbohydrate-binding domain-containing protein n=1 Tax=Sphaeroforma arctica JP610 TaxID=667725 RepID=A0A0L0FD39_9EUKA|nr:hypothetical protein SARC_12805 [Sphaeroforma arctica JP610]KNC74655.1 hypothetical protein SARC_12805 [Sphaeroforma arctica JP610]|eukprot:XP_014148557.1 hypothetical protein SARC_12805 [Sphaeroforma arctica JP610]
MSSSNTSDKPCIVAAHIASDFQLTGDASNAAWSKANAVVISNDTVTGKPIKELHTTTKALYTDKYLYMAWECRYTTLTVFDIGVDTPSRRMGLWEKDVVEVFIMINEEHPKVYAELEFAPNGEWLDVGVDLQNDLKDFDYSTQSEFKIQVDEDAKIWKVEARIPVPLKACGIDGHIPKPCDTWKVNIFRYDGANNRFMALNPTFQDPAAFHVPEAFVDLKFE